MDLVAQCRRLQNAILEGTFWLSFLSDAYNCLVIIGAHLWIPTEPFKKRDFSNLGQVQE